MRTETPIGNIPRKFDLLLRGDMVWKTSPGDLIEVTGIFLSKP